MAQFYNFLAQTSKTKGGWMGQFTTEWPLRAVGPRDICPSGRGFAERLVKNRLCKKSTSTTEDCDGYTISRGEEVYPDAAPRPLSVNISPFNAALDIWLPIAETKAVIVQFQVAGMSPI
jgi:hypothetical protein